MSTSSPNAPKGMSEGYTERDGGSASKGVGEGEEGSVLGQELQAEMSMEDTREPSEGPQLSCGAKAAYGGYRLFMCAFDFLVRTPIRNAVYREALGMPIKTQAAAVSMTKSLDFLLGFTVGYTSDHLRTRWGRRKPFIATLTPVWVIMFLLLANPHIGSAPPSDAAPAVDVWPCAEHVAEDVVACPGLRRCIANATAAGALPPWNASKARQSPKEADANMGLVVYFCVFYFLYYAAGWSGSAIPYDALGMELTSDYMERASLFGVKSAFQFTGYLVQTVLGVAFAVVFATNVQAQVAYASWILAGFAVVGYISLLWGTQEKPLPIFKDVTPVVSVVKQMMRNRPYRIYLLLKIPMTIGGLLPTAVALDLLKYVCHEENSAQSFQILLGVALLCCFLGIPVLVKLTHWYGKTQVLWKTCIGLSSVLLVSTFLPAHLFAGFLMYPFGCIVGLGQAATFIIPDAILADIIDYDELLTGTRTEGMYTVLESNLQQYVEIFAGVLPGILMGFSGFQNNGGCVCGCGVSCSSPFVRWDCPGDIGYACTNDLNAALVAGDPLRAAPCTQQNAGVIFWIRFFCMGLPGLMYLLAAYPAYKIPISKDVHAKILALIKRRRDNETVRDPLTQCDLPPKDPITEALESVRDHLHGYEVTVGRAHGVAAVRWCISGLLVLWLALLGGIIGLMVAYRTTEAVTFGCLGMAALFILIPWELARLRCTAQHRVMLGQILNGSAGEGSGTLRRDSLRSGGL